MNAWMSDLFIELSTRRMTNYLNTRADLLAVSRRDRERSGTIKWQPLPFYGLGHKQACGLKHIVARNKAYFGRFALKSSDDWPDSRYRPLAEEWVYLNSSVSDSANQWWLEPSSASPLNRL
jgi:hypothetical protein